MPDYNPHKLARLANGSLVPLEIAASCLGRLQSYRGELDTEWDILYHLRQVCLGEEIESEPRRALIGERMLLPDGSVSPEMRDVVLSAVRGEGRILDLDSPFTDPLDRAMSEYINARNYIRSCLDEKEAEAFLTNDPVKRAEEQLRSWSSREDDRKDRPADGPGSGGPG